MQRRERLTHEARLIDRPPQIGADALLPAREPQNRALAAALDQVILEGALILEVDLGLTTKGLVERRLGNEEMAAIDDLLHVAEKEGEKQGADMAAVDIGIGHDDDLVVAQLVGIEVLAARITADARAERCDQRADLLRGEHLVEAGALDIEDLAAQRQHRLVFPRTPLLRRAAGGIALDEEQLGFCWIAL